ncbi:hypothetical protein HYC85_001453 [Camellia sinensis]|uniref:Uncharacterized protein n=1 Tax=Camellia sinensis TaxID=4442 RepID=A0A7J7I7B9_CAMSI|nr:hypothetical protein HYC85_001453 [Camellia sinensis]
MEANKSESLTWVCNSPQLITDRSQKRVFNPNHRVKKREKTPFHITKNKTLIESIHVSQSLNLTFSVQMNGKTGGQLFLDR